MKFFVRQKGNINLIGISILIKFKSLFSIRNIYATLMEAKIWKSRFHALQEPIEINYVHIEHIAVSN